MTFLTRLGCTFSHEFIPQFRIIALVGKDVNGYITTVIYPSRYLLITRNIAGQLALSRGVPKMLEVFQKIAGSNQSCDPVVSVTMN